MRSRPESKTSPIPKIVGVVVITGKANRANVSSLIARPTQVCVTVRNSAGSQPLPASAASAALAIANFFMLAMFCAA
jgi:hypothetical protein